MFRIIFLVLSILGILNLSNRPIEAIASDCDDAAKLIDAGNKIFDKDINKAYGFYDTALKLCPDVYYSGHGAPKTKGDKFIDAFLVPSDVVITEPEVMEDTSISVS